MSNPDPARPAPRRPLRERYLERLRGAPVAPVDRGQPLWRRYLTRLLGWPASRKGQQPPE